MGDLASITYHENLVAIFDVDTVNGSWEPLIEVYNLIGYNDDQAMALWTGKAVARLMQDLNKNLTALVNAKTVAEFNRLAEDMDATQIGF